MIKITHKETDTVVLTLDISEKGEIGLLEMFERAAPDDAICITGESGGWTLNFEKAGQYSAKRDDIFTKGTEQ